MNVVKALFLETGFRPAELDHSEIVAWSLWGHGHDIPLIWSLTPLLPRPKATTEPRLICHTHLSTPPPAMVAMVVMTHMASRTVFPIDHVLEDLQ